MIVCSKKQISKHELEEKIGKNKETNEKTQVNGERRIYAQDNG